jgi:hypothetical protein
MASRNDGINGMIHDDDRATIMDEKRSANHWCSSSAPLYKFTPLHGGFQPEPAYSPGGGGLLVSRQEPSYPVRDMLEEWVVGPTNDGSSARQTTTALHLRFVGFLRSVGLPSATSYGVFQAVSKQAPPAALTFCSASLEKNFALTMTGTVICPFPRSLK